MLPPCQAQEGQQHRAHETQFSPEQFCSGLALRFHLALQLSGMVKAVTQRSVRAVDQGLWVVLERSLQHGNA